MKPALGKYEKTTLCVSSFVESREEHIESAAELFNSYLNSFFAM